MHKAKKLLLRILGWFSSQPLKFDLSGERVDILYTDDVEFDSLDMYQKSHFKRYEFSADLVQAGDVCGDFACGTGYGTIMLGKKAETTIGADINKEVINAIKKRYASVKNVHFINEDLLELSYENLFDKIISFETIEHFREDDILKLLKNFHKSLKAKGMIIISTPYMQEKDEAAINLGHHLTFYIDEKKINNWLADAGFDMLSISYQNYGTHVIDTAFDRKDFMIITAQKIR